MMKISLYRKLIVAVFIICLSVESYAAGRGIIGILSAMPVEMAIINSNISDQKAVTLLGIKFINGNLKGRNVVTAITGVGKVNAAMTVTLMLYYFKPSEVIFTGIAGGINSKLQPGDIVIGDRLVQYDLGRITDEKFIPFSVSNPVNQKENPLIFNSDKELIKLTEAAAGKITFQGYDINGKIQKPKIIKGYIGTGDMFVSSDKKIKEIQEQFGVDACEMEGASVAQVCYQQKVPFIVIRSISDNADDNAAKDIKTFKETASKNSANLTMGLVEETVKK